MVIKRDNSTFINKIRLRNRVLADCKSNPVILETHGGFGRIYERTWWHASSGVVIEKDDKKAQHLCRQRPKWAVYQGDSEAAIDVGLCRNIQFDIIDLDPWGSTIPLLSALSKPGRQFPDRWHLVANDGGWLNAGLGGAWSMKGLEKFVGRDGNHFTQERYREVLKEIVGEFSDKIGFEVAFWFIHRPENTYRLMHYWATLVRR